MKSNLAFLLATALSLGSAFLAGCDQGGTAPNGTGSLGVGGGGNNGGTGGSGGTGGTGGTGGGSTIDTTSGGLPIFDSLQLLGPATLLGGTAREALFFLAQDRSLHIVVSSDGGNGQSTTGRETIWDIQIESPDSISPLLVSHEVGFYDTLSSYQDLSNPTVAQNALHFRVHALAGAPEVRVATASKAVLTVSIQAASGISNDSAGWTPAVLPKDSVAPMIRLGKAQSVAGTTDFAIRMPGGGSN
jgi:hypothetical protein